MQSLARSSQPAHTRSLRPRRLPVATLLVGSLAVLTSGCATKQYVQEQIRTSGVQTDQRMESIESQVEANQSELDVQDQRLTEQQAKIEANEQRLAEASDTAREAMARAEAAGKLAEGQFLYETSFNDSQVQFGLDDAVLSDSAQAVIDQFAEEIKRENTDLYIEIQGHTDASGADAYNYELGLKRAESVRRHLSLRHGFPLHRISVISYGESAPVADNGTADGRAQNRRVVLVVLK